MGLSRCMQLVGGSTKPTRTSSYWGGSAMHLCEAAGC